MTWTGANSTVPLARPGPARRGLLTPVRLTGPGAARQGAAMCSHTDEKRRVCRPISACVTQIYDRAKLTLC